MPGSSGSTAAVAPAIRPERSQRLRCLSRLLGSLPRAADRPRVTLRPGAVTDGGKAAWRRRVRYATVPRTTGDDVMPLLKVTRRGARRGHRRCVGAGRERPAETGVVVRVAEDVGSPATTGHHGGPLHRWSGSGGTNGWVRCHPSRAGPDHDQRPGRGPSAGPGEPAVPGVRIERAVLRRRHLRADGHRGVRLHRVRDRRLRRDDRRLGMLDRPAEQLAAWLTDAWTRVLPVGVPACRVPASLR